jgi:hypothetical protein
VLLSGCARSGGGALDLVVEDVTHGRVLHRERVRAGDTFVLSYIHSSEHVPVRGVFRIGPDGALTVIETSFGGFGPGLPELRPGDDWTIRDGMIVARQPTPGLDELSVLVLPITRHRVVTPGGVSLDLSGLTGERGGAVRISAR